VAKKFQTIRGMNDLLPADAPYWHLLEATCRAAAQRHAYQEIRFPILESTALFKRTVGEQTDIVEKEMYTFDDRNGDSLSMRPEGTAGCVRAAIQAGLLYNQRQRLWYMGPMFRHERPQKGRYRQFQQFGMEAYGFAGPAVEVEQLLAVKTIFSDLGLLDKVSLQLNTLGSSASRQSYREALVTYLEQYKADLDEDSLRRLESNPLRILDSKNPAMADIIQAAPAMIDYLDSESEAHFNQLCDLLAAVGLQYQVNPAIVRGLDYYCHTVYEWVTDELGAQGTVCAGGRYNGLVEQLGGKPSTAVGFAMGLERLILLLKAHRTCENKVDVFLISMGLGAQARGLEVAAQLRSQLPELVVEMNAASASLKSQFKWADKSGARYALIIAEDELQNDTLTIKNLITSEQQQGQSLEQVIAFIQ
jgi:histidyl-tRNA synthetase